MEMTAIFEWLSDNAIASGLVAASIVAAIGWGRRAWSDGNDKARIYNFLAASNHSSEFTFRSTEAIAAHTGLSEERVANLRASHPKIRRNEKEKQSWQLD